MLGGAILLFQATACGGGAQSHADGATDPVVVDDMPAGSDTAVMPLALDFSATGCAKFDAVASRCDGPAPLTLTFTPIASAEVTRFLWTFGDDTPDSSERSPSHTYALRGSYRVTLVGLAPGVGSLQQSHEAYVDVLPAPAGAWCDVDAQCADTLNCWCGASMPCAPGLSRGLCSLACDAASGGAAVCPDGTTCADLAAGIASSPPPINPVTNASWRHALCLPVCANDSACATGFRCRDLLTGPSNAGWTRACFSAYPLEIGARCGDALGRPVDADCTSGLCADLGAYRRCAADCTTLDCPNGTGCANFGDGRRLCLAICGGPPADAGTSSSTCDDDPLLACEVPGAEGALGFTMPGGSSSTAYCAPKRCARNGDCAPSGTCPLGGGHCQRVASAP